MAESFTLEERISYLKQHGSHCMAYSTLQPGMEYFDLEGIGYLAYMKYFGTRYVLGNPICQEEKQKEIVKEAFKEHKNTCFVQVYEPFARMLHENFGFYGTQMGVETWIDIQKFNLNGKNKSQIRHWRNTALKSGVQIKEIDYDQAKKELKIIENLWRNNQINPKRFRFLLKDLYEFNSKEQRYFIGEIDGKTKAIGEFDPLYKDNKIQGYYFDINRRDPDSPNGTADLIILEGLKKFKNENKTDLTLGMAPLTSPIQINYQNKIAHNLFKIIRKYGNSIYPFNGVEQHKKKYDGKSIPVFYCSKNKIPIIEIIKFFKMTKLI